MSGSTSASTAAAASRSVRTSSPHALDEVEHLAPLLAHDGAPQQHAELADVAAQRGVRVVARWRRGPRSASLALHGDEVRRVGP